MPDFMLFATRASIRVFTLLAVTAIAIAGSGAALAAANPQSPFHEKTLDNGLTVIVKVDTRAPVAVSMVWYRVGSVDEASGTTGVSHVLEHMMFKGTGRHGVGEFSKRIAQVGGRSNAFTSRDYTAYHQQLRNSELALAFELEADRMSDLRMTPEEFSKEIRVVMEERRQRIADSPRALLYEQLLAAVFAEHPYRTPIIGWMNDLERLQLQDVQTWYDAWYVPNNALIVVVGNVDPQEVFRLAEQFYGHIPSKPLRAREMRDEPEQLGVKRIEVKAVATLPFLAMAYRVPALRSVEEDWEPYALSVLSGVLDGYAAARLERELVRTSRVADAVETSYDGYGRGPALFYVSGTPAAGKSAAQLEQAWRDELARLVDEGVGEEELQRVKAQVVSSFVYQQDSMFSQANQIGRLHSVGLPHDAGDIIVQRLQAVTADQVREVAERYLVDDNLTVAVLNPQLPDVAGSAGPKGEVTDAVR
jgi:zinc protease